MAFTNFYYKADDEAEINFYKDLMSVASHLESVYHLEDTWDNYDKMASHINIAFKHWKALNKKKWWKLGGK